MSNTYFKFKPNVFLAKCAEQHEKGETIIVETRRGKENESIVHNLIFERDGHFYYSIIRADGTNAQTVAARKAHKYEGWQDSAARKSQSAYEASNKDSAFLRLGEPIKVGHHSERRHRRAIEQANNNMRKAVEFSDRAAEIQHKIDYWEDRTDIVNASMPESIEYFALKLEQAKERHAGLKSGKYERMHSFSLTYAKKDVNKFENLYNLSIKLWGDGEE